MRALMAALVFLQYHLGFVSGGVGDMTSLKKNARTASHAK